MRALGWMIVALVASAAPTAAKRVEPPLPEWNDGDLEMLETGALVPGSVLLGAGMIDMETGQSMEVAAVAVPAPEPGEEVDDDEGTGSQIGAEFVEEYFETRPESLLIDPQQMLSQQEYRDRLAFLEYHSNDSMVDLVVYLFGAEQEIPGEVRAEELVERFFPDGRPTAVAFYFFGAPERTQVLLSPQLRDLVSESEMKRRLREAVTESQEKSDPVNQFESFTVQMSIWLYRMEKSLLGDTAPSGEPLVVFREPEREQGAEDRMAGMVAIAIPWLEFAGCVAAGLGLLALCWWMVYRRFRYRFPELDVPARLGGSHGAGIGAVVTFASAGLPPSTQRRRMPDYLQRL